MYLLAGQKSFKDEYKDPYMLPKIHDRDNGGHQRISQRHHGVVRVPLAYLISNILLIQTYGDYPKYATPDNEIITRMLYLSSGKNKLHNEKEPSQSKNVRQSTR